MSALLPLHSDNLRRLCEEDDCNTVKIGRLLLFCKSSNNISFVNKTVSAESPLSGCSGAFDCITVFLSQWNFHSIVNVENIFAEHLLDCTDWNFFLQMEKNNQHDKKKSYIRSMYNPFVAFSFLGLWFTLLSRCGCFSIFLSFYYSIILHLKNQILDFQKKNKKAKSF